MPSTPDPDAELRRRKLTGRLMVIGLLVLVAIYAAVTFINMGRPH